MPDTTDAARTVDGWTPAALAELHDIAATMLGDNTWSDWAGAEVMP